nr:MAG TPA: hypothetical protein [Caudoviricetes sp.]
MIYQYVKLLYGYYFRFRHYHISLKPIKGVKL